MTAKVMFSFPDQLVARMKSSIPRRERSKVIVQLIEKEIERRENVLYECAVELEKDVQLRDEMKEWDITLQDGLPDEAW